MSFSRLKNEDFLEEVRETPCLVCYLQKNVSALPSNPHHEETSRTFGANKRMSDYTALPLCNLHHNERHQVGFGPFWAKYTHPVLPHLVTISFLWKFAAMSNIPLGDEEPLETLVSWGILDLKTKIDSLSTYIHEVYETGDLPSQELPTPSAERVS